MSACTKRCHGCAYTPGATANKEAKNKLVAILSAVTGTPFYCHERMGWTPDRDDYPEGERRVAEASKNLMTAPRMIHDMPELSECISDATPTGLPASAFDEDRKIIGRAPVCAGWKHHVRNFARQGWFANADERKKRRRTLAEIHEYIGLLSSEEEAERQFILADIKLLLGELTEQLKAKGIKPSGLFGGVK